MAGVAAPATNEGVSMLPVVRGETQPVREVLYGAYCGGAKPGIRSVRKGGWKLVKYESPSGGLVTQLFNLKDNPDEFLEEHHDPAVTAVSHTNPEPQQKNLADDPAHAAKRAEMKRLDDPFRLSDQPGRKPKP